MLCSAFPTEYYAIAAVSVAGGQKEIRLIGKAESYTN